MSWQAACLLENIQTYKKHVGLSCAKFLRSSFQSKVLFLRVVTNLMRSEEVITEISSFLVENLRGCAN